MYRCMYPLPLAFLLSLFLGADAFLTLKNGDANTTNSPTTRIMNYGRINVGGSAPYQEVPYGKPPQQEAQQEGAENPATS